MLELDGWVIASGILKLAEVVVSHFVAATHGHQNVEAINFAN